MDESFLKKALTQVTCGSCGRRYEAEGIHVLGHEARLWFLRVVCVGCHTSGLVAAIARDEGRPLEVVTDLGDKELAGAPSRAAVTTEDVEAIRQALENFTGDISKLLSTS